MIKCKYLETLLFYVNFKLVNLIVRRGYEFNDVFILGLDSLAGLSDPVFYQGAEAKKFLEKFVQLLVKGIVVRAHEFLRFCVKDYKENVRFLLELI